MRALLLPIVWLALALAPAAQAGRPQADRELSPQRLAELRARWDDKSPEERELLRRRFEELQSLSPAEREELRERARRFTARERVLREELAQEERARLDALPPAEREALWRQRLLEHERDRGRELRHHLPPEVVERLEDASPPERRRLLHEFKRRMRHERSDGALRHLGRRLGLSREEVAEIEALPLEERLAKLVELERRLLEERLQYEGLPPGVDAECFRRWRRLPPDEFLERLPSDVWRERRRWRDRESSRERLPEADGRRPRPDRREDAEPQRPRRRSPRADDHRRRWISGS